MENKSWKEKVLYKPKNGYDRMSEQEVALMHEYCEGYKKFWTLARPSVSA